PVHKQDLEQCLATIDAYTVWYEKTILGCTSERWLALHTTEDFYDWLEASAAHRHSVVGVFTRFSRSIGLPQTGKATPHLLSAGCYYDPEKWHPPFQERHCLQPAGFYNGDTHHRALLTPRYRRACALFLVYRPGRWTPSVGERDQARPHNRRRAIQLCQS